MSKSQLGELRSEIDNPFLNRMMEKQATGGRCESMGAGS